MTRIIKRLVMAAFALAAIGGAVFAATAASTVSADPPAMAEASDHDWF